MENIADFQFGFGEVAYAVLHQKLPLRVCRSAAGFYIGTLSSDSEYPMSRESVEYFRTFDEAEDALENGTWNQNTLRF